MAAATESQVKMPVPDPMTHAFVPGNEVVNFCFCSAWFKNARTMLVDRVGRITGEDLEYEVDYTLSEVQHRP